MTRVRQGSGALPEASIKGEILKNKGNEQYRRVGTFEGDLAQLLEQVAPASAPGLDGAEDVLGDQDS